MSRKLFGIDKVKFNVKKLLSQALVFCFMLAGIGMFSGQKTQAAVNRPEDYAFDYIYYADTYPDLKAAFGYNEAALKKHWLTYGIAEGRGGSPVYSGEYYLLHNADLLAAFGRNNYRAAYNHFITFGYKEKRASSTYYNGVIYAQKNGDLSAFSSENLIRHYLNFGVYERRLSGESVYQGDVAHAINYTPLNKTQTVSNNSTTNIANNTENNVANTSSFQWPVSNMYVCGNNWSAYYKVKAKDHLGVDIKSSTGDTTIYAAGNGVVANTGWNSANGNTITIKHTISGKTVYSFYGHLKSVNVSKGQTVSKGQPIGVIGNTGNSSTGTHLHFAFTTQCSAGTWGYGTSFSDSSNIASYSGYKFYNPAYVISNGRLP